MSTANQVPETWGLTGDDAKQTLERTGRWTLVRDAFKRLRYSDGFSHARSMAYATTLVFLEGIIALVGLASALGYGGLSDVIVKTLREIVPGPAGAILTDAVQQAHKEGSHFSLALIIGLAGALITGTTLLGQIERALNRLYGIEQDRPTGKKYGRAFVLTISAGVLFVAAFAALGLGRAISSSLSDHTASTIWNVLRWPLALGLLIAAIALLFKWSPRRHQPGWSWLAFGAIVSVILLAIVTVALDAMFQISSTFGKTYGPLAGIVALILWSLLASVSLLFGAAIGAQLEAVRAGRPAPQSAKKVMESEPDVDPQVAVASPS
ncbi:MAG: YihY/virulence factor BrkB family protein [Solirubrobacterales bacterium]